MLYNELEQGDILSGVRFGLALLAYTDILLCSIWVIHRIRQTPVWWNVSEVQKSLRAQARARLGIRTRECFFLDAICEINSGVGESICSLTPTGHVHANW
jgi:hypothetical protein